MRGRSTPGKRSVMMFSNKGKSYCKNLGTLTSRNALKRSWSSSISGVAAFKRPAALMTDLTALIP